MLRDPDKSNSRVNIILISPWKHALLWRINEIINTYLVEKNNTDVVEKKYFIWQYMYAIKLFSSVAFF